MTKSSHWDFPRTITTVRILLDLGVSRGVSLSQCLQGTWITPQVLEDPHATISARQELQVIRNLQEALGGAFPLGLEMGVRHRYTAYGIWGLAVVSSPTFVSAVSVGLRYLQLTTSYCRVTPVAREEEAALLIDDRDLPADMADVLIESVMAMIVTLQADLDPVNLPIRELRLKRSAPVYASRFQEFFGVMPVFGATENAVAIDIGCLGLKLPQANELTRKYCETECQKLLELRGSRQGYAAQVRDRLARNPTAFPSMPQMAELLETTVRTLRRRLANEGITYEGLVDEVRGTLAEELLRATTLTMEEISERLGYAEPSAFSRAFRRWKGVAPKVFRQGS